MAYTYAEVTATELAKLAEDKPLLAYGASIAKLSGYAWVASAAGTISGPDVSAAGYNSWRAVDGYPGLLTKPNGYANDYTLAFYFSSPIEFDCVFFLAHNLWSEGITTLKLQIADNTGFTTNLIAPITLANPTMWGSDNRFAFLDVRHTGITPLRYSGVQHVRFIFQAAGAFLPIIGQIILGRRTQLHHKARGQYDFDAHTAVVATATALDGSVYNNHQYSARRNVDANFLLTDSARFSDVRDTFWPGTRYFTHPFIMVEDPYSSQHEFLLLVVPGEERQFVAPTAHWVSREWNLSAIEQGPYFAALEF